MFLYINELTPASSIAIGDFNARTSSGHYIKKLLKVVQYTPYHVQPSTTSWDHIVLQGISPTLKYWPCPFLPRPLQKNSKSVIPTPLPPPFMTNPPQNVREINSPPLEMYPHPKKERLIFFIETKYFISNII